MTEFIGCLSITIPLDYNSHIELLLDNEPLTVVWTLNWSLTSSLLLLFSTTLCSVWVLRYDSQSASLSWNKAPIWGLRPDFYYCQTVAGLLMWGALSHERTGLSFIIAAGPRQRSHSQVRVSWDSRLYFTVSLSFETSFLSPPTTRRATVEVYDPASTSDIALSGNFLSFHNFGRTVQKSPPSTVPVLCLSALCWIPWINSGQRFDSCVRRREICFNSSLSSNGLFRSATGTWTAKPRPANSHITAFRRHVTVSSVYSRISGKRMLSSVSARTCGKRVLCFIY
jgi:hypothetical protein